MEEFLGLIPRPRLVAYGSKLSVLPKIDIKPYETGNHHFLEESNIFLIKTVRALECWKWEGLVKTKGKSLRN